MIKNWVVILIFGTMLIILPLNIIASIIFIPADQPTIQAGIDMAMEGDTVLVADGIYKGDGNRDIDFKGKAIAVMSEHGPESCLIDCEGSDEEKHRGFCFKNNEQETSIVRGFTIKNGYTFDGGGIFSSFSSPLILDCIFTKNFAHNGGGICCNNSNLKAVNCNVSENSALLYGGGIFICFDSAVVVANSLVSGNRAINGGAGIEIANSSSPIICNCTITQNRVRDGNGGGFHIYYTNAKIYNCILWENTPEEISLYGEQLPDITFSDIQNGYLGLGNIDSYPLFADDEYQNYRLSNNSPCIDTGTNQDALTFDLDGNPRPQGGCIDMGAYEYLGWPSITRSYIKMPSHTFKPGDIAYCVGYVWNAQDRVLDEYLFFAVLDVFGTYYCAPSFSDLDYYYLDCNPGITAVTIITPFTWPANVGSASGIVWYAALMNPEMTELASEIGIFDFSWSP